jgi:hypothetical protein
VGRLKGGSRDRGRLHSAEGRLRLRGLFLYDQAKNADFAGDLLNVSADTQAGTHHDAYLNGCTLVTEDADVTLHVYGFGYDSDSGAGSRNLMNATLTTVKLTPAT